MSAWDALEELRSGAELYRLRAAAAREAQRLSGLAPIDVLYAELFDLVAKMLDEEARLCAKAISRIGEECANNPEIDESDWDGVIEFQTRQMFANALALAAWIGDGGGRL